MSFLIFQEFVRKRLTKYMMTNLPPALACGLIFAEPIPSLVET